MLLMKLASVNVITGRNYFSLKFTITLGFFSTIMLLVSCFERSPCFIRYLQNVSAMLTWKFQGKVVYHTSYIILLKFSELILFLDCFSCTLSFLDCSTFFFTLNFLANSKSLWKHVFYKTILMFWQIVFFLKKWEQYYREQNNDYINYKS